MLTTHINPDGDAIGSEMALNYLLKGLGKEVRIINDSPLPYYLTFLDPNSEIETLANTPTVPLKLPSLDGIFILDISDWQRLGRLKEMVKDSPALKICLDQIQRIVKISRNLHQAAHPSPAERRLVDIGVSIQEALFVIGVRLKSANVQYLLDISPTMPMIALDPDKIERLMINLIFNALHAMEGKEEKILRITLRQVDLSKERNWILISIADNGIGIKKEDLPKIFEPFFTTKAPGKGTGLGLSVCHGIVTEHGGKIWAENNENDDAGGATFFISLPVNERRIHTQKVLI